MNNIDMIPTPKAPMEEKEREIAKVSLATHQELSRLTASIDKTTHTVFSPQMQEQQEAASNEPTIHQYDKDDLVKLVVASGKKEVAPFDEYKLYALTTKEKINLDAIRWQHADKPAQLFFFRKERSANPHHVISPLTDHITARSSAVHIESFEYKHIGGAWDSFTVIQNWKEQKIQWLTGALIYVTNPLLIKAIQDKWGNRIYKEDGFLMFDLNGEDSIWAESNKLISFIDTREQYNKRKKK